MRRYVRKMQQKTLREEELMKDVPGWDELKKVYHTTHYVPPFSRNPVGGI